MTDLIPLDPETDRARVTDLCARAADYVRLETGRDPDITFVTQTMTAAPPGIGPEDTMLFGLPRPDGRLKGIATCIRGHYAPGEWYMGLLLLDPAERNSGLGSRAAQKIIAMARADGARAIRIAALEANPAGRRFWERQGFGLEKTVPGADHTRHVLKLDLQGGAT